MAEVRGFRGWRYDLGQVGDLGDVTAPPYDVINPAARDALYQRHPCNVIRLILNREEPGETSADDKYQRAASFLRHWQSSGTLIREHEDALYVYHQQFEWGGKQFNRCGFLGLLKLEPFGTGMVFPHEQTMPGPKADRLKLLRACQTNLSPVFGLYPDEDRTVQELLEPAIRSLTPLSCFDEDHVGHRIWPVTDHNVIEQVRAAMRDRPVFIADGHHRYETACAWQREAAAGRHDSTEEHPADYVLMHFVGMGDPGLVILPTHRLIEDGPVWTAATLKEALQPFCRLTETGQGPAGAQATWELMQIDGRQQVLGFGTPDGSWLLAEITDTSPMQQLAADHSPEWRSLGVSLLHRQLIDHLLAPHASQSTLTSRYAHQLDEVTNSLEAGTCRLACLVPPAEIEHVELIAAQREQMPPKSTFFYPKLLSGLVFNSLE